jgi:hypothetical protein
MKKPEIDMSDEAVTRRLEEVRALYKLMLSLREARVASPPKREQPI